MGAAVYLGKTRQAELANTPSRPSAFSISQQSIMLVAAVQPIKGRRMYSFDTEVRPGSA